MLQLGIAAGTSGDTLFACVDRAVAVEEAGLDFISYGDSQGVLRDAYSVLTACALRTRRIELGPMVTNPVTRHPVVLANVLATLDEASEGRAYLAIGAGASSVANAALRRAKPSELAAALRTIRSCLGDASAYEGEEAPTDIITIGWARRRPPLIVHASGPLGFGVAAEQGDGLLIRLGDVALEALPALIEGVRARRRQSADPLPVWAYAPASVGSREENWGALSGIVSARSVTLKPEQCPPDLLPALERYQAGYDYRFHASTADSRNADLLRELDLFDYMRTRFSLAGEVEEVAEQLARLERAGVNRVLMQVGDAAPESGVIPTMGRMATHYRSIARAASDA